MAVGGFDGKSFLKTIEYLNVRHLNNGWSLYYKPDDFEALLLGEEEKEVGEERVF
jgi:hypothetical protein